MRVDGHKHLYRDKSGAIINHDTQGYSQYIRMREKKKSEEDELKRMRSDIDEIKFLLQQLLNKN